MRTNRVSEGLWCKCTSTCNHNMVVQFISKTVGDGVLCECVRVMRTCARYASVCEFVRVMRVCAKYASVCECVRVCAS